MKKESPFSQNSLIKDFVNSKKKESISEKDKLKEAEEHKKISLFLYDTGKKLLDNYGKEHPQQLSLGAGGGVFGMRIETVMARSTPMVSIEIEEGEIMLRVSEGYTTGSHYYKNNDRVVVSVVSFGSGWVDLLDISKTKEETKNWLAKKATTEELNGAINLFPMIEQALKRKSKIKPLEMIGVEDAKSILLRKRKPSKR